MTEVISKNPQIGVLQPRDRLIRIAETILQFDLTRYDLAIRQWAVHDAQAARGVRRVDRIRLKFVGQAFRELGFTGDDLEMRTMLFVCYHTWEAPMFRQLSRKRRRELIDGRVELLTRP